MGKKDNKVKKKELKKVEKQKTEEKERESKDEIEIRHSRLELIMSALSLLLSIISLLFSYFLTNRQLKMEYGQSLPNLSMSSQVVEDEDKEVMRYVIKNDGGIIREAVITPHLFLVFSNFATTDQVNAGYYSIDIERSVGIEIMDAFAPYWGNGLYYFSGAYYNPDMKTWTIDIDKARLEKAYELQMLIVNPLEAYHEDSILTTFDFILEVRYVDIMGEEQVEWYAGEDGIDSEVETVIKYTLPSQLTRITNKSEIPLSVYRNAGGINIEDGVEILEDEATIDILVSYCYEALYGK